MDISHWHDLTDLERCRLTSPHRPKIPLSRNGCLGDLVGIRPVVRLLGESQSRVVQSAQGAPVRVGSSQRHRVLRDGSTAITLVRKLSVVKGCGQILGN